MKIIIPRHLEGKELYKFLLENKALLITQKKSVVKHADPLHFMHAFVSEKGEAVKAAPSQPDEAGILTINPVINTTFYFDSHGDVHIDGLWKESIKNNKRIYLVQEHKSWEFEKIITSDLKAITKKMSWRDLGEDYDGVTEALIFSNCKVTPKRNPFMYDQYKNGYVDNHSVGMQYVNLSLAINDEDYKEEFAEWNKYIDKIANQDDVMKAGYFWPVKEAKIVEGSAVPLGSNPVTPTLNDNMELVDESTKNQPPISTETRPQEFDLASAIKQTNFFNP